MWALGFGADRNFAVRVECQNCPGDPWRYIEDKLSGAYDRTIAAGNADVYTRQAYERANRIFIPTALEKKFKGRVVAQFKDQGWSFKELLNFANVNPEEQVHREAYVLLLAMLQHADSKVDQQRMQCPENQLITGEGGRTDCRSPILFVHDLGWTFGHGWNVSRDLAPSKMILEDWKATPVWRDRSKCRTGNNNSPFNSSFQNIEVREEGRSFLANLLEQLSRKQIEDIFRVARVDLQIPIAPEPAVAQQRIRNWADAFESKRREIVETHCPR